MSTDIERGRDALRYLLNRHSESPRTQLGSVMRTFVRDGDSHISAEDRLEALWRALETVPATPSPDSGERMREALTPSGGTKAAYMGEFKFDVMFPSLDEDDDEPVPHRVTVPWDTIKEIMAAIAARAALQESAR